MNNNNCEYLLKYSYGNIRNSEYIRMVERDICKYKRLKSVKKAKEKYDLTEDTIRKMFVRHREKMTEKLLRQRYKEIIDKIRDNGEGEAEIYDLKEREPSRIAHFKKI